MVFNSSPYMGEMTKWCSFHLVPHFEECPGGVTVNLEFMFW
jgi:hypothetical protein